MTNACTDCAHYDWDFEDSDGHIVGSWVICGARHAVANLKQFPFKKTECGKFKPKLKEPSK